MSVSKRTRFEVLRRDNYTCRYCRSTENDLHVDHVTPVSLGGGDDPSNLVAACKDCNLGKASTAPDAEFVAQLEDDTIRWASAIKRASEELAASEDVDDDDLKWFRREWNDRTFSELPGDWERSIATFVQSGMTDDRLSRAIVKVATKTGFIPPEDRFRYFCGICWSEVRAIRARAVEILAAESDGG